MVLLHKTEGIADLQRKQHKKARKRVQLISMEAKSIFLSLSTFLKFQGQHKFLITKHAPLAVNESF